MPTHSGASSVQPLLDQYSAICASASQPGASDEVLYGRAGTLLGALLLRQHLGPQALPDTALTQLAQAMLSSGALGCLGHCCCCAGHFGGVHRRHGQLLDRPNQH
jgi:hypothetical protein